MIFQLRWFSLPALGALALVTGCIGGGGPSCGSQTGGPGTPALAFTSVPALGSTDPVKGVEEHVVPTEYYIAIYILVPNQGWWVKPYYDSPETKLSCNGEFSSEIVTGGNDANATNITAFLLPTSVSPPLLEGQSALPQSLFKSAAAVASVTR